MEQIKMTDREAVEILKQRYPGMSKSVYSMGKNPDRYGVELTKDVLQILGVRKHKLDRRRKPHRIMCRLNDDDFEQFELARGGEARQDFLESIVRGALQL